MDFTNNVISLEDLPRYEEVESRKIDEKYRNVILWNYALLFLFFAGVIAVVMLLPDLLMIYRILITAVVSLFLIFLLILQLKAFRRRSWAIREHDILYRHGLLSVITTIIPFNRIQHVAIQEGVFPRLYGLAALKIFTAGGSSADIRISGLKKEEAARIKEWILDKIDG